jgi:hypothetical protein
MARKRYTREFKREAALLAEASERPLDELARELGIQPSRPAAARPPPLLAACRSHSLTHRFRKALSFAAFTIQTVLWPVRPAYSNVRGCPSPAGKILKVLRNRTKSTPVESLRSYGNTPSSRLMLSTSNPQTHRGVSVTITVKDDADRSPWSDASRYTPLSYC